MSKFTVHNSRLAAQFLRVLQAKYDAEELLRAISRDMLDSIPPNVQIPTTDVEFVSPSGEIVKLRVDRSFVVSHQPKE